MQAGASGRFLGDVRFYIAVSFVIRLYGITDPPLETSHHWRQTSVAMVARNLVEDHFDVFHPRMDTAGELSGITGMEFPFLNMLIACCIALFGPAHWYGRVIVLITSSIGLWAYHRLVDRYVGRGPAFYSTLALIVSLWFMYSRKMMPDVMALSLVIIGLAIMSDALHGRRGKAFCMAGLRSRAWGC